MFLCSCTLQPRASPKTVATCLLGRHVYIAFRPPIVRVLNPMAATSRGSSFLGYPMSCLKGNVQQPLSRFWNFRDFCTLTFDLGGYHSPYPFHLGPSRNGLTQSFLRLLLVQLHPGQNVQHLLTAQSAVHRTAHFITPSLTVFCYLSPASTPLQVVEPNDFNVSGVFTI